jgi:hypothetical protein
MTNTLSTEDRLSTDSLRGALVDSPYSNPLSVKEALERARKDQTINEWPDRLRRTLRELEDNELVVRYLTRRGGQGGLIERVKLSELGHEVLARAARASLMVANGLL